MWHKREESKSILTENHLIITTPKQKIKNKNTTKSHTLLRLLPAVVGPAMLFLAGFGLHRSCTDERIHRSHGGFANRIFLVLPSAGETADMIWFSPFEDWMGEKKRIRSCWQLQPLAVHPTRNHEHIFSGLLFIFFVFISCLSERG